MRFILGGFGQGKLTYALEKYCAKDNESIKENVYDENNFWDIVNVCTMCKDTIIVWNHFNLCVKKMIESGHNDEYIGEWVGKIIELPSDIIIICDEIGNGIIPIDENEVRYRELTGRLGIMIAKKADSVERIICGIAQKIK